MPMYEYRCRACAAEFTELRSMDAADDVAVCPQGHDDTVRLLSLVARRSSGGTSTAELPMAGGGGGGCCGGGCCAH